jgi:hypothetical protein
MALKLQVNPTIKDAQSSAAPGTSLPATGLQPPEVKMTCPKVQESKASSSQSHPKHSDPNGKDDAVAPKDPHLEQVLSLAKRGLKVFPLAPHHKLPIKGFKWKELATDDEDQISEWFAQYYDCNWAVRTGAESKVFVLDVDDVAGRDSLSALLARGSLPATLMTHTGKELSFHLWFAYPSDVVILNSANNLGPGLDVRGQGGYVVVPPSIHPNGSIYKFDNEGNEISPAPEWLMEAIAQGCCSERPYKCSTESARIIPVGARNETLFRDACALRRRGATEQELLAYMELANLRCEKALSDSELKKIAHSAFGYSPAPHGAEYFEVTLSPAAMHGVAGKIVKTIMPHTEADEAALLMHFLAAYGNAIGRSAHCSVDGAMHYTNIFIVCVGATAKGRKGTSWNRVRSILELVDGEWAKRCIQSGLSSGEGLVAAANGTGVTTSATGTPIPDTRLFILEPELASVLKRMTREGNTLSATIRNAWDTGSFQIMVKKHPIKVDDSHVSIVGHITFEELRRHLNATDFFNGFANRFLFVQSTRSKCLPEGGSLSEQEKEGLASLLKPVVEFGRKAGLIERDVEAKEMWSKVYPSLSEGHSGLFGAAVNRAEAQVLRLSLLYALLDCSNQIRRVHLEAALSVWEYCENTAWRIFGNRLGDSTADEIASALRARPEGMTRNEIIDHFHRHKSGAEIQHALNRLLQEGYVRRHWRETAGRPAEVWLATAPEHPHQTMQVRGEAISVMATDCTYLA